MCWGLQPAQSGLLLAERRIRLSGARSVGQSLCRSALPVLRGRCETPRRRGCDYKRHRYMRTAPTLARELASCGDSDHRTQKPQNYCALVPLHLPFKERTHEFWGSLRLSQCSGTLTRASVEPLASGNNGWWGFRWRGPTRTSCSGWPNSDLPCRSCFDLESCC